MKENPLVSVVIPCLNRADFLIPTIESILQQDYPHIECIVVDGGSTDGTLEILKSYGSRITWISEPDNGHADAINKGWQMSKGEILAWLNADDLWDVPHAVGQTVTYFQTHLDIDVVYGDCGLIDANGKLIRMADFHEWDLTYAVEHCYFCIPQPAAFIRRSILEKVNWLDTAFYQKKDHELWLRIGLIGNIKYIPVLLAHARNIEGLSFDGVTAAPACIQVTKKFYSLPNVPLKLKRKKRRAFSNSYVNGMDYAFVGGQHWRIIFTYALWAILYDPTNAWAIIRQLNHCIAIGATTSDKSQFTRSYLQILNLPGRIFRKLKRWYRHRGRPKLPNLLGDRDVEYSWVISKMPSGPGTALDFGGAEGSLALIAAQKNFEVTAVDLQPVQWSYVHSNLHFIQGDILKLPLPSNHFDLIMGCSTVEHVGLVGRYGVNDELSDGDLKAMAHLRTLIKSDGVILLTIPVGQDDVFVPLHRVYGVKRLPQLLKGYRIEDESFWIKNGENKWVLTNKDMALNFKARTESLNPLQNVYALGCFMLKKKTG